MEWNGTLEWYNILLVILYLVVIAIGLGSAWRRWRWIGLIPLAFSGGYALATAVGRFSGWRYDLPADWVWYFYFGIGFAELLFQSVLVFGAKEVEPFRAPEEHRDINERSGALSTLAPGGAGERRWQRLVGLAILFAFIGALPWMIKNIASPRYEDPDPVSLQGQIGSVSNAPLDRINAFVSQSGASIQTGRVLYPRFFSKEDGLASANPWPAYALREYPRIGFLLLNQSSVFVVFPTKRLPEFPHAQDAIVLGCEHDDHVEARWIIFPGLDSVYTSEAFLDTCPP
jgi:hypothetical protein